MSPDRIPWAQLPNTVHRAAEQHLGSTYSATDAAGGGNADIATILTTPTDTLFIKGIQDKERAEELHLEYRINPYLPHDICPRARWHTEADGWVLLAFDAVNGDHADYTPGATGLKAVTTALTTLSGITAPPLSLLTAWDRWGYYCDNETEPLLHGNSLLHTDLAATNIIVNNGQAHVIDWSWAARGPAWIDPTLWAIRLISDGGHSPAEAVLRAQEIPAFREADPQAVAVLARAEAARWADVHADGAPGIDGVTHGARQWANYWARQIPL
ncbi:aminoglycoside phosphotransferase [Streptomyces sp. NPDC101490]|uniref:aminoglycoside phosphotransferase n=1 Tax=Streptomyces sp. NPDC101490 TaxID=3366143 RepID=UPI003800B68B